MDRFIHDQSYCLKWDGEVFYDGAVQRTWLPLCGFLENVYLQDFDETIENRAAFYVRCGDDILIGAETEEEIQKLAAETKRLHEEKHLSLSETKTMILEPGTQFVFMGWSVCSHTIDFTEESLKAIQEKIRLKTKELLAYCGKAGIPPAFRMPSLIPAVRKAVNTSGIHGYFPIVTTDVGLERIDGMLCEAIRIVSTGKRGKGKYRVSYRTIREWGCRSLVSRWYRHLKREK